MEQLGSLPLIILFGGLMYLLLIRPQQKRQKEHAAMLRAVKVGDDIVTVGGLHGTVVDTADETIDIQVNDTTVLRFQKSAVSKIVVDADDVDDESSDDAVDAGPQDAVGDVPEAAGEDAPNGEKWPEADAS